MGLDKNFPRHPHAIISPDVRWYPGSDAIGEKGREYVDENFSWESANEDLIKILGD